MEGELVSVVLQQMSNEDSRSARCASARCRLLTDALLENKGTYQAFFWVLIDLIIDLLDLSIK